MRKSKQRTSGKNSGDIIVSVNGLRNTNGVVRWAIYPHEKAFSDAVNGRGDNPAQGGKFRPQVGLSRFTIRGLPYGDYGLLMYHDENENNKMDKRALKLPKERVGISNYNSLPLRRPVWRRARFGHNQARTQVTINTVR